MKKVRFMLPVMLVVIVFFVWRAAHQQLRFKIQRICTKHTKTMQQVVRFTIIRLFLLKE